MDTFILILLVLILGALLAVAYRLFNQTSEEPREDASQKIMLELMGNLRKEVQESGGKNRVEMTERLDRINEQLIKHQHNTTENLQKQFN
ncbi:MAG: hypothetical protein JKY52_01390 [Flavobacteriales bacterium]|nr:hypothetical protein [Flavobacteriales bacterium]